MAWKKQRGMPHVQRLTHDIDATNQVVGRLATRIARLLIGKTHATYVPHIDAGDRVTVANVDKLVFTGKKWKQKVLFRSSNRPGGLKRIAVARLRTERPSEILRHAVKYMLPKNRTQSARLKRLRIL